MSANHRVGRWAVGPRDHRIAGLRTVDRHLCKSMSTAKHKISGRAQESAQLIVGGISDCAPVPLGRWSLLPAGPDIHLQSETPKSPHRRLSLCSLPVPKQSEGGIGSCPPRPGGQLRDLAACASSNPVFVLPLSGRVFQATALSAKASAGTKSCFLRSTASRNHCVDNQIRELFANIRREIVCPFSRLIIFNLFLSLYRWTVS